MKHKRVNGGYILRFERGEEILETLKRFLHNQRIQGGFLSGIGVVDKALLGLYDWKERKYKERAFVGDLEVGNLTGIVSWVDDEPSIHIHATIADENLSAFAGHLLSARVSITLEVFLREFHCRINRRPDAATGLNFLDI